MPKFKFLTDVVLVTSLVIGFVVMPVVPVVWGVQSSNFSAEKDMENLLDRWLGRAAEYGVIGLVALWLLRVIIVDVKSDIKLVSQLLMQIADQSKEGGNEVKRLSNEINIKIDRLFRDIERIEYKRQQDKDDP